MAIKNIPQFQRPEGRADFERARNAVRAMLGDGAPDDIIKTLTRLDADLDEGVFKVKAELLGSVLCWKPDDRTLSAWIYDQHCEFAELARRAADLFERRSGCDDPRTLKLIALAFLHWGEAAKWVVGRRERYDYGWMHWLMRMALTANRNLEQCEVRLDARARSATIESLFLRTLLLDRFAGGNLTRQQIEVLDAWLWEWMPVLKGLPTWPGQAVLRADLDGKGGLRHGRRLEPGPTLYLPIAPLEQKRQAVIKEFHRGRIVPSLGVAADFRVEEHVAVLEQLRIVFEASQDEGEQRVVRKPTAGPYVEVWLGLSEILARGLSVDAPMTPQGGLALKGAASLSDTQRIRQIQFLDEYESTRRLLRLADVSATGYGFDATEKEATGIGVGDLVGIHLSEDEPCVLGRVVRRVPGQIEGQVTLGVLAISKSPQALTLSRTQRQGRPDDDEVFIYVPGGDHSGAQDAFLVPEKILQEQIPQDTRLGEDMFTIQFNRVRRKGRGWALAGFEILDARRVAAPPPLEIAAVKPVTPFFSVGERTGAMPKFELVEKGNERGIDYDDPWGREVSSRLL
jgi:hypothetical protein